MTDYEKIDAALGAYALGVSVTIFYFTVLTSYLIVAYFAGKNLTKSQVGVITGLFIIAALYATWGSSAFMAGGRFFQESTASVPMYSRKIQPIHILIPLQLLGILASLKFMWDVRKTKE